MKRTLLFLTLLLSSTALFAQWKTIADVSGNSFTGTFTKFHTFHDIKLPFLKKFDLNTELFAGTNLKDSRKVAAIFGTYDYHAAKEIDVNFGLGFRYEEKKVKPPMFYVGLTFYLSP